MKYACGSGGRVTLSSLDDWEATWAESMLRGIRGTRCRRTPRSMSEYGGISPMLPRAHVERFRKRCSRNSKRGGSHHLCRGANQVSRVRRSAEATRALLRRAICPHHCPCELPKQRFNSQRQPTRVICEVEESEGFKRTNEDVREAGFRLANRLTRLSGSLRFDASSWSVGSIWGKSGPPSPSR
jgi:hypothetical protein